MKDILKAVVFAGLFAIPFLTLYVESDYFFPFITGKNFGFRIILDITLAAWVLLALVDAKYRPQISGIVWSFGALLVIMFFANLFGENPRGSFWSNFERMDGYVSLVHTFLYALMLGSVIKTRKHWQYLFGTSLFVAFLVAAYGLAQYGGLAEGSGRIDSRLGNAAYMAVYMLFHIFIAFWLFVESKQPFQKIMFMMLAAIFTFVLIQTGTRGTVIGLAVGILTMSAYIGLFGTKYREIRKYAIGVFALLAIVVAGFVAGRDSQFVQDNSNLSRIANISLTDLTIRATIWSGAWEGVKERPVLGWGQSNFNYVFNKYYDPSLYAQEQWFDRSHNIIFDWLVTGGFLGFFAYFSIFAACGWYLFLRPILHKDDESFTVLERAVLLGILAGYLTHNFVVFDNIVSYIFFAMILGLIHSRVSTPIAAIEKVKVEEEVVTQFAAPVVVIALGLVIYFVHMPAMGAAGDIINAFRSSEPQERLEGFKKAVDRNSFAHQEVTEQLTQQAIAVFRDPKTSPESKQAFGEYAESQLLRLAAEKPEDARVHVFIGSFYRSTNQTEKAAEQMQIAHELSPLKQSIIEQQGLIAISEGKYEEAVAYMQNAFELDKRNNEAREFYAASLMYVGDVETAESLMDTDSARSRIALSDFVVSSANQAGEKDFMAKLFEIRTELQPETAQNWATLAYIYYETGQKEKALEVLSRAKEELPSFASTATCFAGNIEAGNEPQEGC